METRSHLRLKQLAVAFLREHGCLVVATEVRCPISRYRVDVAGYRDPPRPTARSAANGNAAPPPRTVMIECKQSRADFLRDRRDRDQLLGKRRDLERFRRAIEEKRIRVEEPELCRRAGSSLFPEMEQWDFSRSRLPAYRSVVRRLRRLDAMLHGETKFCMAARYALADRLYLAAPRGLLRRREIPPGWGLLECSASTLEDDDPNADLFGRSRMEITVKAPDLAAREERRQRLLRNIAVSASREVTRGLGVMA